MFVAVELVPPVFIFVTAFVPLLMLVVLPVVVLMLNAPAVVKEPAFPFKVRFPVAFPIETAPVEVFVLISTA